MRKDPRLKVGLVFDDTLDSSDGVAQYVKTLGAWLSAQGHDVSYLVGQTSLKNWSGGEVNSLSKNIKVRFNGNNLTIPLPANRRRIKQLLSQKNFDVLHVMLPYSPFMAAHVIRSAGNQTAIIGTFHIFPSGKLSAWGSRLLRFALSGTMNRFDRVVSVSPAAADFAYRAYGIESSVVPNAVDLGRFRGVKAEHTDSRRIVFLGRLVERKGAGSLLKAFARLAQTVPDVQLIIAGDGPLRSKLSSQASKLGVSQLVHFRGFIPEDDKPALLASADIACFPSLYGESFGIVLIEAMAAGAKTVLAGNNPGYASVLGEQPILLVNPLRTDEFASRMAELLNDVDKAAQIHEWQTKTVEQYDINVVGEKILGVYSGQIARLTKKSNNKAHGKP